MSSPLPGKSSSKRFTPLGIIVALAGLLLFAYFVKRAGVGEILGNIKRLGAGFLLVLAISSIRHIVRSLAWTKCLEAPDRLRFRDAFRARLMGDALGNIVPLASMFVSEPSKPALIRDRVPLMAGISAIAIENLFYSLSVSVFIFSGMTALLLTFDLPKALRYASISGLVFIFLLITGAALVIRKQLKFLSGALEFLYGRGIARRWLEPGRERVSTFEDRIYGFYQRNRSRFVLILALEACFHLAGVLEVYVTLSFISYTLAPTFFTAFILESVNRVINVVFKFVPMRMGVDEFGTGKVSGILKFAETTGVTLAIVRKGRDLFWTAVGVAFLLHRGLSLRGAARDAEAALAGTASEPATLPPVRPNESA
jgi:glycosyltransferase 2 family protein